MDHKQPETHLKIDNSTTGVFLKSGMKPKHPKTRDIKWYWLRDKEVLDQLIVYWYRGTNNENDYFTKHHPQIHHRQMKPCYIHTSNLARTITQTIRLCEGVLNLVPCNQSFINYLKPI